MSALPEKVQGPPAGTETTEGDSAETRAVRRWGMRRAEGAETPAPKPVTESKPKREPKAKPAPKEKPKKGAAKGAPGKAGYGSAADGVTLEKRPVFVWYKGRKSKPEVIARAIRSLTIVLKVGQSEARALEIVGNQFHKFEIGRAFESAAKTMRDQGASLKQALIAEEVLPRTVRELVEAAQTSMALHQNLAVAATLVGEAQNVKKKLLMNLIQPGFMLALCIGLLFAAVTFIIPNLISSFSMLGSKTPTMTLMVLQVADVTKYVLGGFFALAVLFVCYWIALGRKSHLFRVLMDTIAIKLPAVGPIVQYSATSRLFQLLSANLSVGMGEPDALRSAANGCGNEALKDHCVKHAKRMGEGAVPLKEFVNTRLIPTDARNILATAPSVRQEIEIMDQLAPEYQGEAGVRLETLNKTLDPIINLAVYGIAGLLIISIVLPMYSMYPELMKIGQMP